MKGITKANASNTNSDMNNNLELEVDNSFRFASDKEIEHLKENRLAKNTEKSTHRCVNLFKLYLEEKSESADFKHFATEKLKEILPNFM